MNNPEVRDLPDLISISECLVPDEALAVKPEDGGRYWEGNDDPAVRRIEVLLECAIDGWEDPEDRTPETAYAPVVRLWFGLDPSTRKLGQADRHEAARKALPNKVEPKTFRNTYARKFKDQLGLRLWSRYKSKAPFSLHQATKRDKSAPPVEPRTARWKRVFRSRLVLAPLGVAVLAAAVVAFILLSGGSESPLPKTEISSIPEPPPNGTIVNAMTGQVDSFPDRRRPEKGVVDLVGGGPIFRACVYNTPCKYHAGRFTVSIGQTLRFLIILDNDGTEPIPYARFSANFTNYNLGPNESEGHLDIGWPGSNEGPALEPPQARMIVATKKVPMELRYVRGSTKLRRGNFATLAQLPEGIMTSAGIGLTDIGRPKRCFLNCTSRYLRFITFEMYVQAAT